MSNDSSALVQKLWNYCNVLRDDGVSYGDYVEQLTYLLFLKMDDEQTKPPFKRESKIPKKYKLPKISLNLKLVLFSEILYWLGLAASFTLVITFLVTDTFTGSISWIAFLFIGLYFSMIISTLLADKYLDKSSLLLTSIIGMFILLLSAVVVIFSTNLYWVLCAMVLEGIGAGICQDNH